MKGEKEKKERDVVKITVDDGTEHWIGEDELKCIEYLRRIMPR